MMNRNMVRGWLVFVCVLVGVLCVQAAGLVRSPVVSIVTDAEPGASARHGIRKLSEALQAAGASFEVVADPARARGGQWIVVGAADRDGPAARLLSEAGGKVPQEAEALAVRRIQRDDQGFGGSPHPAG